MAILYLITHAHTQQRRDVDATRWVLSPTGAEQARRLAAQPFWNEIDQIVVSSEPKTRLTVEPVLTERSLPVAVDPRFDELKRGPEWIDSYAARVAVVFAQPAKQIGGWEAAADALARFLEGIAAWQVQAPEAGIALVGHGLTLSLYRAHLLGRAQVALDEWRALSFAAVAQVDRKTGTLLADFQPVAGVSPRG